MLRRRRRSITEPAVNAARVEVTAFGVDPYGRSLNDAIRAEGRRAQGIDGGHIPIGANGDPANTWNGPLRTPQTFAGASAMATAAPRRGNIYRDPMGRDISTGVVDEGPFADPTMRMFAHRMSRRSPM